VKNVTVRDAHGNEIAFYKSLSNNKKLIESELGERFGSGKYKLCFRVPAKKGKAGEEKKKAHPTTEVIFVGDQPGSTAVVLSGGNFQTPRQYGGGQSLMMLEKMSEILNTMNGFNQKLVKLEEKIDSDEEDDDEEDDDEEDDDEEDSLPQKLGVLIANPKYSNLFRGILTGNPDTIRDTLKTSLESEPETVTELIGECITIILKGR